MRRALALSALALGIAAGVLPVTSASASCITVYYNLTGECSPCRRLPAVPGLDCIA